MIKPMVGLMVIAFVLAAEPRPTHAQDPGATMLAEMRQALGGDHLDTVHSFTMKASIRVSASVSEDRAEFSSFELACELPDKFVRTEGTTTLGFNGDRLIYRTNDSPSQTLAQVQSRLLSAKQDFAEVTFVLFASSFAGAPLQFSNVRSTGLSVALVDMSVAGTPPLSHVAGWSEIVWGGTRLYIASSKRVAVDPQTHLIESFGSTRYTDYRDVAGMKVPFRMSRIGGQEVTIREFKTNVAINPKVFRPSGG